MKDRIFEIILVAALLMGIYSCWPDPPYEPPLRSIEQVQQFLVDKGYDIDVDGRLGPETEEAWIDYMLLREIE